MAKDEFLVSSMRYKVALLRSFVLPETIDLFGQTEIDNIDKYLKDNWILTANTPDDVQKAGIEIAQWVNRLSVDIMALNMWLVDESIKSSMELNSAMLLQVLNRLIILQEKMDELVKFHKDIVEDYQKSK